jgi:hypothetical protein
MAGRRASLPNEPGKPLKLNESCSETMTGAADEENEPESQKV